MITCQQICYHITGKVGDDMAEWITVKQLAQVRNCSERLIIKEIQAEKLTAKREGRRWMILVDTAEPMEDSEPMRNGAEQSELIAVLKQQLEEKDKQISKLQEDKQRTDMIIIQMTRNQQLMLESIEQKGQRSWWSRLWKREPK